jgi:hypothetical protein
MRSGRRARAVGMKKGVVEGIVCRGAWGVKLRALVVGVWEASVRGMIVKRAGVQLC